MAENTILCGTLQTLVEEKKYATLRDILVTMNPADIAAVKTKTADSMHRRLRKRSDRQVRRNTD